MSLFHRALLCVTRRRAKSMILFLILVVLFTLALTGLALQDASQTAQLNVRQALGGSFVLTQNTDNPDKWENRKVEMGIQTVYTGQPITTELADTIRDSISGIRGCNASLRDIVVLKNAEGEKLTLVEDEGEEDAVMNSLLAGYGDFNETVGAYASTDTRYDTYFAEGYLKLSTGSPLTEADAGKVLISRALAEANGLQVGDSILLCEPEYTLKRSGEQRQAASVSVEIAGLFETSGDSTEMFSNWSMENSIFTTLSDLHQARPTNAEESYESIRFYARDPADVEDMINAMKALPLMEDGDFTVSADTASVDAVMEPLKNMEHLVTALILLILCVGAAVLYLVLSGRIRERSHETGVFLALGVSRWKIFLQYLCEMLLIAFVAFGVSVLVSGFAARTVGSRIINTSFMNAGEQTEDTGLVSENGVAAISGEDMNPTFTEASPLTEITVTVKPSQILLLAFSGFLVLLCAITLASFPVMRLEERNSSSGKERTPRQNAGKRISGKHGIHFPYMQKYGRKAEAAFPLKKAPFCSSAVFCDSKPLSVLYSISSYRYSAETRSVPRFR